jgi:hypothetical protein
MLKINPDLRLTIDDYEETRQADMTSRLLPDHMSRLTEWYGYGTLAGLRARATYYTTDDDSAQVEDNGGDWGEIDWGVRLSHVDILTDDEVVVVTLDNPIRNTDDLEDEEEE